MNKSTAQRIIEIIPDVLKTTASWIKKHFDKDGQEILNNATGTIGLVVKFFGKPLIDNYFEKRSKHKLDDYGSHTYIVAAYNQASKSIEKIENFIKSEKTPEDILAIFSDITTSNLISFDKNNTLLIFQPQYHPIVVNIKKSYIDMLQKLNVEQVHINTFLSDFNDNIEKQIQNEFGSDYEKHKEEVREFNMKNNEAKILWETARLSRIGFDLSEDLKYEETYGQWKEVSKYRENDFDESLEYKLNSTQNVETKLKSVKNLINQYFSEHENINKILFVIADFGKGKSVFLKHYASEYAKKYVNTKEGLFPIYFNLRDFKNYDRNSKLGVISDFLQKKYAIDIGSDYFKSKKYIFLIDSLDESGDLSKASIDNVINSIKQIQSIDATLYRDNRIIISSRPINEGLDIHLKNHEAFCVNNEEGRPMPCFISLYGFKKEQFNNWLHYTLKEHHKRTSPVENIDFVSALYEDINNSKISDIFSMLIENKTLGASELRRPIFAYMIYQLIINNIDFLKIGKIGIYLSFINLLTKDAKHIKDPNYSIKLEEEFQFRNVLHAISALWMYERHRGKQGALKKADVCRVLDAKNDNENDQDILLRYKERGVVEINFLSHSYFGEENNILHFQHQSFAEILLAEYYLKIFIKYALDDETNIDEIRSKLILGVPTEQTINFFVELISLLKSTTLPDNYEGNISKDIIEKRKLIFPLLASLSNRNNNTLFCHSIFYSWYQKFCNFTDNQTDYPISALENWAINNSLIEKIILLCSNILNSNNNFILSKAVSKSCLFDSELMLVQNEKLHNILPNIDRWLALLLGNNLHNEMLSNNIRLFNRDLKINYQNLLDMLRCESYANADSCVSLSWKHNLFKGVDFSKNKTRIKLYNILNNINFSHSHFSNIDFSGCLLGNVNFSNCYFDNVDFSHCYFWGVNFNNIQFINRYKFNEIVVSDVLIPTLSFMNEEQANDNIKIIINTITGKSVLYTIEEKLRSLIFLIKPLYLYKSKENDYKLANLKQNISFENQDMETLFWSAFESNNVEEDLKERLKLKEKPTERKKSIKKKE